jgi:ribosomal protein S18 acetylase RimI-like enzyme
MHPGVQPLPATGRETGGAIVLRAASAADGAFLFRIYASTRAQELALLDWSDEQKDAFVSMQHQAQDSDYRSRFPDASFAVIEHAGEPVGRLYVARTRAEIRILDIALLPQHRDRGIATALLLALQAEAGTSARRVVLHVERHSRARDLYDRLGFAPVGEVGVHLRMEWLPGARVEAGLQEERQ